MRKLEKLHLIRQMSDDEMSKLKGGYYKATYSNVKTYTAEGVHVDNLTKSEEDGLDKPISA